MRGYIIACDRQGGHLVRNIIGTLLVVSFLSGGHIYSTCRHSFLHRFDLKQLAQFDQIHLKKLREPIKIDHITLCVKTIVVGGHFGDLFQFFFGFSKPQRLQAHEKFFSLNGAVAIGVVGFEQGLEFVCEIVARFHVGD